MVKKEVILVGGSEINGAVNIVNKVEYIAQKAYVEQ